MEIRHVPDDSFAEQVEVIRLCRRGDRPSGPSDRTSLIAGAGLRFASPTVAKRQTRGAQRNHIPGRASSRRSWPSATRVGHVHVSMNTPRRASSRISCARASQVNRGHQAEVRRGVEHVRGGTDNDHDKERGRRDDVPGREAFGVLGVPPEERVVQRLALEKRRAEEARRRLGLLPGFLGRALGSHPLVVAPGGVPRRTTRDHRA